MTKDDKFKKMAGVVSADEEEGGKKTMDPKKEFLTKEDAEKMNKELEKRLVTSLTDHISKGNKTAEEALAKKFEQLQKDYEVLFEELKGLKGRSSYLDPEELRAYNENLEKIYAFYIENEKLKEKDSQLHKLDIQLGKM